MLAPLARRCSWKLAALQANAPVVDASRWCKSPWQVRRLRTASWQVRIGTRGRWHASLASSKEQVQKAACLKLPELLKSCGLEQFAPELRSHSIQELQSLLSSDKDALYDVLIDARMKTRDRNVFVKALAEYRSRLPELLKSCGLEQYVPKLESYELKELQSLLATDKDALYDILIDAGMKTGDRKVLLKMLEQHSVEEVPAMSAPKPILQEDMPSSRTTVSYMLSPGFFTGQWSLERNIWQTAAGSGRLAMCYGVARFIPEGLETEVSAGLGVKRWLRYTESGEQLLSPESADQSQQQKIAFTMTYLYQHSLLQDRLDVFFDRQRGAGPLDEDIFCSFNLAHADFKIPLQSTRHYCRGDLYEGEFTVNDENSWKLQYSINGPTKALMIETKYRRLEPSSE